MRNDPKAIKILLPYLTAVAEGKTVQWRSKSDLNGDWVDLAEYDKWGNNDSNLFEFRIKPEKRVLWAVFNGEELLGIARKESVVRDAWSYSIKDGADVVKMIEADD